MNNCSDDNNIKEIRKILKSSIKSLNLKQCATIKEELKLQGINQIFKDNKLRDGVTTSLSN